jgi:hypothetical protein
MKQKTIDRDDNQIDMSDLSTGYFISFLTIGTVTDRHLIYKE